jgi:protein-disulfide isomerase
MGYCSLAVLSSFFSCPDTRKLLQGVSAGRGSEEQREGADLLKVSLNSQPNGRQMNEAPVPVAPQTPPMLFKRSLMTLEIAGSPRDTGASYENVTPGRKGLEMVETDLKVPVNEHDHRQGPEDAQITLVEYGDYACPYCAEAYSVVKEIQKRLGTKLRVVFRNFPLPDVHPHAPHAAEAAAVQGKFWEMHDTLYEHQDHC